MFHQSRKEATQPNSAVIHHLMYKHCNIYIEEGMSSFNYSCLTISLLCVHGVNRKHTGLHLKKQIL